MDTLLPILLFLFFVGVPILSQPPDLRRWWMSSRRWLRNLGSSSSRTGARIATSPRAGSSSPLTPAEVELVRKCLEAAVDGPFFPEWEFEVLMGLSREEMREICARWPDVPEHLPTQRAVHSALGNLVGYPHRMEAELRTRVGVSAEELDLLFDRLVGGWLVTSPSPSEDESARRRTTNS